MNVVKKGLLQLDDEQLQRVLDTPRDKLTFSGMICDEDGY